MTNFGGKTVLITGAANGIGKCLAEIFAGRGADLILVDRDTIGLHQLTDTLENKHGSFIWCCPICLDLASTTEQIQNTLKTMNCVGCPSIIINNAGIGYNGFVNTTNQQDWERLFKINVMAPIAICNTYIDKLKEQRNGHIVNISSGQRFFQLPTWTSYATTKTTLGTYSEALGIELEKYNVDVTTVYPFMVNTGFYKGVGKNEDDSFATKMSMKLLPFYSQRPKKVANIIVKAIEKKKRVEMVHPLNWVGYHLDTIPQVGYLVRKLLAKVL